MLHEVELGSFGSTPAPPSQLHCWAAGAALSPRANPELWQHAAKAAMKPPLSKHTSPRHGPPQQHGWKSLWSTEYETQSQFPKRGRGKEPLQQREPLRFPGAALIHPGSPARSPGPGSSPAAHRTLTEGREGKGAARPDRRPHSQRRSHFIQW